MTLHKLWLDLKPKFNDLRLLGSMTGASTVEPVLRLRLSQGQCLQNAMQRDIPKTLKGAMAQGHQALEEAFDKGQICGLRSTLS